MCCPLLFLRNFKKKYKWLQKTHIVTHLLSPQLITNFNRIRKMTPNSMKNQVTNQVIVDFSLPYAATKL